jgi:hypothetical protein
MLIRWFRFNIYLAMIVALALGSGCRTAEGKRKRALTHMTFHMEANPGSPGKTEQASVFRESPARFTVQAEPFLTEANILAAQVIDQASGGFSLAIQFDRQGTWLLESESVANRSRHYVVRCQWGEAPEWNLNTGRWLAAPEIARRITDGVLIFTPDTTREEAAQIALGLNNVIKVTHATSTSKL